jgi:hypothetical protein
MPAASNLTKFWPIHSETLIGILEKRLKMPLSD